MTSAWTPSRSWSVRRAAGSHTLAGAESKPLRLCAATSSDLTPAPKKPATGVGVMFSQTKNSPSLPLSPCTVCGARSLNLRSSRSAHILGGSTKCESAEMMREFAISHAPIWFVSSFVRVHSVLPFEIAFSSPLLHKRPVECQRKTALEFWGIGWRADTIGRASRRAPGRSPWRALGLTPRGSSAHDSYCEQERTGGSIMASGTGLLVVWTDIASEYEADFNEWYSKEHIPQLLGVPGFQTGRRYQAVEGSPKYMAIYQLADENVLKSDGFRAVRENPTAWTKKITPQFRNTQRGVYRQILSHGNPPQKDAQFVL